MSITEKTMKDAEINQKGCLGMVYMLTCIFFGLFLIIFGRFPIHEIIGFVFAIIGALIGIYLYMRDKKIGKKEEEQQKKDVESVDDTLDKF
jgi:hypothetical protein